VVISADDGNVVMVVDEWHDNWPQDFVTVFLSITCNYVRGL
jgi:hypothetical protein